jgi:hypothetical protein
VGLFDIRSGLPEGGAKNLPLFSLLFPHAFQNKMQQSIRRVLTRFIGGFKTH